MMTWAELEGILRGLLTGEYSSLTISYNDEHAFNYMDAREFYGSGEETGRKNDDGWISLDERERALAENSVWTCQWFPRTPVVSCILRASSLPALLEWLMVEVAGRVGVE